MKNKEKNLEVLLNYANDCSKDTLNKNSASYKIYVENVCDYLNENLIDEYDLEKINLICNTGLTMADMNLNYGKNVDVTGYVNEMFGPGIVKSAFIIDEYNEHVRRPDIVNFSPDAINLTDCCTLIINLCNGKTLNIWSSEWGRLGVIKK